MLCTQGNRDAAHGNVPASHDGIAKQPTAGIVHDLGNLIQVASSALNRVAREPGVSAAADLEPIIASAQTALQRAGALVRETIGRARGATHEMEQSDVGACLEEVETLIRSAWEASFGIEVRAASNLPRVLCDPLSLQNAVLNLVFNARDAMPDGGSISIDAAVVVQDFATLVELRVADSGIGMTQETVARAFDPFFTTKSGGLGGVGLPMVKRFVEEHGGSVDINSIFGAGTIVMLRLPAAASGIGSLQAGQPASSNGQARTREVDQPTNQSAGR